MSIFNLHVWAWINFLRSAHSFIHPERNLVRSPRFPQPRRRDTWIWTDLCSTVTAQRETVSSVIRLKTQTWRIYEAFIVTCFSAHLFWFSDDSDSDSELSVDEHSSSYASSHSSDSEDDDDIDVKPKWNNERQPVHSTPKGMQMLLKKEGRRRIIK